MLTYGIIDPAYAQTPEKNFDYAANRIVFDDMSTGSFDFYYKGQFIDRVRLNVVGVYNISNSLPAIGVSLQSGIPMDVIKKLF